MTRDVSAIAPPKATVGLCTMSDVLFEKTTWLWENWLAEGMLHILAGEPGVGKSTIALTVAAIVSSGGKWPDGTQSPVGDVLIWSGEDSVGKTIKPRLSKAGANLNHIYAVTTYRTGTGGRRAFDPSKDIDGLCKTIGRMSNIKLVILDPVVLAVANDSHKNLDMHRGLSSLADLAEKWGVAVIGVTCLNKNTAEQNPLGRIIDGIAIGTQARVVWAAAEDEGAKQHVICLAKSSIGPKGGGWRYELGYSEIETDPYIPALFIDWRGKITGSAFAILSEVESTYKRAAALSEAKAFLRDILSDGPMDQTAIEERAKAEGLVWATVWEAKDSLGIERVRV